MKIVASYLYPDFSYKRKYNNYSPKKSVKKNEKTFEEYLKNSSQQINKDNHNNRKVI
jgi:uncharacterized membrane protein YvbJ